MASRGLAAAALVLVCTAARANSYDGKWVVVIPGYSDKCPSANMHIAVAGPRFTAEVGTARFTYKFFGAVGPDGSFDMNSPGGTAHTKGKFTGSAVAADFSNSVCGTRSSTGGREH